MKLAFFSPMPPAKTGIAKYSSELVQALVGYCDITVFVPGPSSWVPPPQCDVIDFIANPLALKSLKEYDQVLYHLGNNPWFHFEIYQAFLRWPGVVVLHDLVLYYLIAGFGMGGVAKAIFENYGADRAEDLATLESMCIDGNILRYPDAARYPFLRRVLDSATGVIVHNHSSATKLKAYGLATKIHVVPLLNYERQARQLPSVEHIRRLRAGAGAEANDVLVGIFGFIGRTKRIDKVLEAVSRVQSDFPSLQLKVVIVGEGDDLTREISQSGIPDRIKVLGFVSEEEFAFLLASVDIVANLRYPSMGESSASLIQAMSLGKPTIVTNDASFSEIPDDAVLKVGFDGGEVGEISAALVKLGKSPQLRVEMGEAARNYVEANCAADKVARQYAAILSTKATERASRQVSLNATSKSPLRLGKPVTIVGNNTSLRFGRPLRILLIKLDHRGDLVLASPAIKSVGQRFPSAFIDIVVGSWNVEICHQIHPFNRIYEYDFFKPKSDAQPGASVEELRSLIDRLPQYDVAVDLRRSPDTRHVLERVSSSLKIGYATGTSLDDKIGICLPQEDDLYELGMLKEKNKLSSALQMVALTNAIPLHFFSRGASGAMPDTLRVAVFPGAGQDIKEWPRSNFLALVEKLVATAQIDEVIVFLSPQEDGTYFIDSGESSSKLRIHRGISTSDVLQIVKSVTLIVGNNSFGSHIGSLFGVATLGIYGGPEWWEEWQPLASNARIIYSEIPCFPCHLDSITRCPNSHACMTHITPDIVFNCALEMILTATSERREFAEHYLSSQQFVDLWHTGT